ncbi:hypothetical protein KSP40_PGU012308 [Platanthera guangdongensis]|uniref:Gamma-tubulin complex component n=1 Tax=Platanthera guangdongensis TaxID=2320717 RepID=A0ABR2LSM6_9ASPA
MESNLTSPQWNVDRPFLTGRFHQEIKFSNPISGHKPFSLDSLSRGSENVIGSYPVSVQVFFVLLIRLNFSKYMPYNNITDGELLQELLVIDDLLFALVGIEGRYISIKRVRGKEGRVVFQIDPSMDLALQELIQRLFPLCEAYVLTSWFVETKSRFGTGLVTQALAAAMRALLLERVGGSGSQWERERANGEWERAIHEEKVSGIERKRANGTADGG